MCKIYIKHGNYARIFSADKVEVKMFTKKRKTVNAVMRLSEKIFKDSSENNLKII